MSNTQATLFLVSLGILATLIRSMLDQGQAQFQNRWLLPAIAIGVCGAVVTIGLGVIEKPRRADVGTYAEQKLAGREPEGTPPAAVPGRSVGIAGISDTLKVFLERLFFVSVKPDMTSWMIYGAYGFSGKLIAEEAVRRGHRPLLAGRNQKKLAALAENLGLEHLVLRLDDWESLAAAVSGCKLVLNTAGPYAATHVPVIEACLAGGSHYLDICGELRVIPDILAYDEKASAAGIAVVPAVGFDVVPSDCLVRYVSEGLPDAQALELAISGISRPSVGTVKTSLDIVVNGGFVRRDGKLEPLSFGQMTRTIRFSDGRDRLVMAVPWADLATAYRSTGIPNITVFFALKPWQIRSVRWTSSLTQAFLSLDFVQRLIKRTAGLVVADPDAAYRDSSRSYLYARATDNSGDSVEAWLETMESYHFTAVSAVRCVEKTLSSDLRGALTPSQAFGSEFILEFEDTVRYDELQADSRRHSAER